MQLCAAAGRVFATHSGSRPKGRPSRNLKPCGNDEEKDNGVLLILIILSCRANYTLGEAPIHGNRENVYSTKAEKRNIMIAWWGSFCQDFCGKVSSTLWTHPSGTTDGAAPELCSCFHQCAQRICTKISKTIAITKGLTRAHSPHSSMQCGSKCQVAILS